MSLAKWATASLTGYEVYAREMLFMSLVRTCFGVIVHERLIDWLQCRFCDADLVFHVGTKVQNYADFGNWKADGGRYLLGERGETRFPVICPNDGYLGTRVVM
ncbi:uncharacterized protein LOC103316161 [Nasonia vitripennis]|uniref:Uncharacterized protein n=1 Tax=Nasonia vitripennis TaxID=7425 RepID=A0A7M7TA17_NASVI|nr:uncharacterized protein LOC103316161 [Nasonia vitripennis]